MSFGRFPATPPIDIPASKTKTKVKKKRQQIIEILKQLKLAMEAEI
tara:strand:+ start:504 stop:641 length:138 start_codon:yes stop_codon:yes gene_type:complete